jgi:hypothetical protein
MQSGEHTPEGDHSREAEDTQLYQSIQTYVQIRNMRRYKIKGGNQGERQTGNTYNEQELRYKQYHK